MSMEWMVPRGRGAKPSFLREWEANALKIAHHPPSVLAKVGDVAVEVIATTENLKLAWNHAARYGGQAVGPDRKTFSNFTRIGSWNEIERLSAELREDRYRHGPVREVKVPKRPGSTGTRTLAIPNVQDRVVGRAVAQILEPLFRPRFDERSFCRPGRGSWQALAHAQLIAEREDRWIWIAEDIVGAFDHVPFSRLLDVVYSYIPSDNLLDLIRRSIGENRDRQLWQGAPLSPLLMNIYLDALLDRPWRRLHPDVPLLRYMDDILILCRIGDDVVQLYRDLASLIEDAALKLKHGFEAAQHDMENRQVGWLGYQLRKHSEGLEVRLPFEGHDQVAKDWRQYLSDRFQQLHKEPRAPEAAMQTVYGILAWAGPTLPWTDTRSVYETLRLAALTAEFEELPSFEAARRRWTMSHEAWLSCCKQAARPVTEDVSLTAKELTWDENNPPWEE